jgi:hypothetical protein
MGNTTMTCVMAIGVSPEICVVMILKQIDQILVDGMTLRELCMKLM